MEELQSALGQGPGIDAVRTGLPVLVDRLATPPNQQRRPAFAPEAGRHGVGAVFSQPLAGSGAGNDESPVHRPEVRQAAGMVSVQLGIGGSDALLRLRAYSYATDRPLIRVARAVVGRLRVAPDDENPAAKPERGSAS